MNASVSSPDSSSSLADELMAQLRGAPMQNIAQHLGTSPGQTSEAVAAALPLLLGALGRNAAQPQGATALFGALQRDHAGAGADLGGLLGSLLGGGAGGNPGAARQSDGAAILGHILGGKRQQAEQSLGSATGLGANAGQLLQLLAPIVMAFLARRTAAGGMDPVSLGQVLGQERVRAQQGGGLAGGLLGSLLDQDGDGQLGLSDLVKIGGGLLGGRR